MRISDWSSDVCSSDLVAAMPKLAPERRDERSYGDRGHRQGGERRERHEPQPYGARPAGAGDRNRGANGAGAGAGAGNGANRSRSRGGARSEEHTSELQSLMRIAYAVFCLKTKNK